MVQLVLVEPTRRTWEGRRGTEMGSKQRQAIDASYEDGAVTAREREEMI